MTQFHQAFFDESVEGVDAMEAALLDLDPAAVDPEAINTIFRAAHSIKGGGATFGFEAIANFTHLVETLLDEVRAESLPVTRDLIDALLAAIDCLRALIASARGGADPDAGARDAAETRLRALLGESPGERRTDVAMPCAPASGWNIAFRPHPGMLKTGNDPLRMLKELAELGTLDAHCDKAALPALAELDPETSYLAWDLTLTGEAQRNEIDEVFEWVDGDCELAVTPADEGASPGDARAVAAPEKADDTPPPRREARRPSATHHAADSASIRVGIDKIDALINIVGELVITQSMLNQFNGAAGPIRLDTLHSGLDQLESNTRELREAVMRIRMLPISFVFNRFPRMVHDLGEKLGKRVNLSITGEQTELDKTVLEKIGDPLVHLVRNAIDHGIEEPAERSRAAKPETGRLSLGAWHEGGSIFVEIADDGRGLDRDAILAKARARGLVGAREEPADEAIYACIFEPGFSTRAAATDLSGRGVGMDVVHRNLGDLGGAIAIRSRAGLGTTFTITLPLTLAIMEGQSAAVGEECYIVPLASIIESLQASPADINRIAGGGRVVRFRGEHVPIIRLADVFGCAGAAANWRDGIMIIAEGHGRRVGLFVDRLLGQQQAVVKSLTDNYRKIEGISGATVMGDGRVALILDIPGLMRIAQQRQAA